MNGLGLGSWHPEVVAGVLLLAGLYRVGARRTGGPTVAEQSVFGAALVVLLLALNGPLHDLSDGYLFSAHMVQHLLLTLAVPPLLLLGTPGPMVDEALARLRPLGAAARVLRRPIPALALYTVALVVWHLPVPYGAALEHHALHVVEHLTLMAAATFAWWPVLGRSRVAPALPYGAQLLYLFAFGIPMTVVGAMVTGAEEVLYPFYAGAPRVADLDPLADQRLGGLLMWVPAGLIPLVAFTAVFFRWAAADRDSDDVDACAVDSKHSPK